MLNIRWSQNLAYRHSVQFVAFLKNRGRLHQFCLLFLGLAVRKNYLYSLRCNLLEHIKSYSSFPAHIVDSRPTCFLQILLGGHDAFLLLGFFLSQKSTISPLSLTSKNIFLPFATICDTAPCVTPMLAAAAD